MKPIDEEEKELVESFNSGEWKSLKKKDQKKYIEAAKENIELMKKVNIHLSLKDYNLSLIHISEPTRPY